MSIYAFNLRLLSPAFIAGVDKNHPEMRAASVRGQLRYWLRALLGARNPALSALWDAESAIFGSTTGGAGVSVRVYREAAAKIGDYPMLPHRQNEGRRQASIQKALSPGQVYDLQLATRPGTLLPTHALDALRLWSLLGGVGRRSRRMFGAVQITAGEDVADWYSPPQSIDELAALVGDALRQISSAGMPDIPKYPTLNAEHSWVIVGTIPYPTHEDLVKSLFVDLLRKPPHLNNADSFGGISPRRSSPIHAQVRRVGADQYYPVLTALRSKPDGKIRWDHVKQLMEAAEIHFSAQRVWGGW